MGSVGFWLCYRDLHDILVQLIYSALPVRFAHLYGHIGKNPVPVELLYWRAGKISYTTSRRTNPGRDAGCSRAGACQCMMSAHDGFLIVILHYYCNIAILNCDPERMTSFLTQPQTTRKPDKILLVGSIYAKHKRKCMHIVRFRTSTHYRKPQAVAVSFLVTNCTENE